MAATANVLIAGAMGQGYAGLSARQCLMCLLYVYSNGATLQAILNGAAAMGFSGLSDHQIDQSLLYALQ